MASGWSAMSKIPGAARSDKAKETHMDKLTPFFKKKKRILKKGLTNGASRRKIITNFKPRNRGARKVSKDGCIREPLAGVNAAA